MSINIDKYKTLPKQTEANVLLDLLQEIGANIYHCNELFKLYWVGQMADAANEYIALAERIKNRIIFLMDDNNA